MTTKKLISVAAAIFIVSGCVKDPIYHTSHPQHGQITVTADWNGIGDNISVPSGYTVAVGETAYQSQTATYTIPDLIDPGDYTLYLYNEPSAFTFSGTTAYVAATGIGDYIEPMPGWLFTGKTDAPIEKDHDYDFMVGMRQRVRELTLIVNQTGGSPDRVMDVIGTLSGVAGSYDMASDTRGEIGEIPLTFSKITSGANAGKWQCTVRLLGITGGAQKLTGLITFKNSSLPDIPLESDLSDALKGFNDDMTKPLVLDGATVETYTDAGMTAVIEVWETVVIEDGYADMLTLYVTDAGLGAAIQSVGVNPLSVGRLRIAGGELTNNDFVYMRTQMPGLTELDMKNATVVNNEIPWQAFAEFTALTSVILPNSVTQIDIYAFRDCTSLGSVTFPENENFTKIGQAAFQGCTALKTITLPNSVTQIGTVSFGNCTSLESVTFPENENFTIIGQAAFQGCTALKTITLPNSVTQMEMSSFHGCTSLESVTFPENENFTTTGHAVFQGCTALKAITIPISVTRIGQSAFQGCTALKAITFPNSVTQIETGSFSGCTSLGSVTFPENENFTRIGQAAFRECTALEAITIPNSVTQIGTSAFEGCTALETITIPNSVTQIGPSAFQGCTALESVTLPENENFTTIDQSAFQGCTALETITIPNSITRINQSAFEGCTFLESVTLPENENFTRIGQAAFQGCTVLEAITIPNSVTEIGTSAFQDCISLESVICLAQAPPMLDENGEFINTPISTILVPAGSVNAYKTAPVWSTFANIIAAIP